jgi:hypothetical protein
MNERRVTNVNEAVHVITRKLASSATINLTHCTFRQPMSDHCAKPPDLLMEAPSIMPLLVIIFTCGLDGRAGLLSR